MHGAKLQTILARACATQICLIYSGFLGDELLDALQHCFFSDDIPWVLRSLIGKRKMEDAIVSDRSEDTGCSG
jgi:hypothetical protein